MNNHITAQKRGIFSFTGISAAALFAAALTIPFAAQADLITGQLDEGMRNNNVTSLQTFLAQYSSYYPEALVTGYFGPLTAAAVKRYQSANNLDAVGRVGPMTLALINSKMSGQPTTGTGGSDDVSAPIIYQESVSTSTNSATISWNTNEAATSRVMFGTSWPFLLATAPSARTSGFNTQSVVTLTGLTPRTTYYYVLESVDLSGNIALTVSKWFVTQ